jgi:hypothetical protein
MTRPSLPTNSNHSRFVLNMSVERFMFRTVQILLYVNIALAMFNLVLSN